MISVYKEVGNKENVTGVCFEDFLQNTILKVRGVNIMAEIQLTFHC